MTDTEFIEICYRKLLQRAPDDEGKAFFTAALDRGEKTREDVLLEFLDSEEFNATLEAREFVPPGHFYSAVPSREERERFPLAASHRDSVPGIDLNHEEQLSLLRSFQRYYDECPFPERKAEGFRYYFDNPSYSYSDALTLYSFIRHSRPARIIEIGSGFSSCVTLDTNDRFFDGQIDLTFIEPYPELLHSLMRDSDRQAHKIIPETLQDVPEETFKILEEGDILFVDSTHVSKLNSDVNKVVFDILPALQTGVLVHFHDIFWPFEYPKEWIREGRAWNEAYLLRSFLEFNDSFEILFFSDYLHQSQTQWIRENMPLRMKNPGGCIWLRKLRPEEVAPRRQRR